MTLIHSAEDTKLRARETVRELVDKYAKIASDQKRYKQYNEAETKTEFIEPLFKALGWDIENKSLRKEVTPEEKVSNGRVDYGFRINDISKFFLEAKKLRANLDDVKFIKQAIDYSWNKACTWAVLTDFEGIKIFNAEVCSDDYYQHQFMEIKWTEFLDRFEELWLLSKEAFELGLLDKVAEKWGKKFRRIHIDKQLLDDITMFRAMLSANITHLNKSRKLTKENLDGAVQRILNRLIFIRYCEDKELEEKQLISDLRRGGTKGRVIQHIRGLFKYYGRYNSKLFAPHLCDDLEIDNEVLHDIIDGLYHPKDAPFVYDFSAIESDVLGNIYEQYLGHILKTTKKKAKLTASAAKRKQKGIYYTPSYIVDYIVRNTIGKLLANKQIKPEKLKIKVLDMASGSGSFLIKAFDVLEDYHIKHDKDYSQTRLDMGGQDIAYRKRLGILQNNIFGVDLDKQAVEITELNLFLKIAQRGHKLPLLEENIKHGNSLIDSSLLTEDRAFRWNQEFQEIMKEGGFDVVVGNPPYGIVFQQGEKSYLEKRYHTFKRNNDIFVAFVQKGIELLKPRGLLSFILPNTFLVGPYFNELKKLVLSTTRIVKIVDFGVLSVFQDPTVFNAIIVLQKEADGKRRDDNTVSYVVVKSVTDFMKNNLKETKIPQENFESLHWQPLDNIIVKANKIRIRLGDIAVVKDVGLNYWTVGRGKTRGGSIGSRILYEGERKNAKDLPFLKGRDIDRYGCVFGNHWLVHDYEKRLHKNDVFRFSPEFLYVKEKIIYRQTADRIIATIDTQKFLLDKTVHLIVLKEQFNKISMKYLLAILNSKLLTYIYRSITGEEGATFAQVKTFTMKGLPIILPDDLESSQKQFYNELVKLTDKMVLLKKQLAKFDEKIIDERAQIEEEITRTAGEIDEIIYEIYNITDEEKKVIEQRMHTQLSG